MLFLILGPSSLPVVVAQVDERHANRIASVSEWYERHGAYNIYYNRRSTKAGRLHSYLRRCRM